MKKNGGVNEKNHDTGLRILEILKLLLTKNQSRKELIADLKINGTLDRLYTPEAMFKYFNTLQAVGLDIEKNKAKYTLKHGFYGLTLSNKEIELLTSVLFNYRKLHDRSSAYKIQKILEQLDKYTNTDFAKVFSRRVKTDEQEAREFMKNNLSTLFERYIYDKQNVSINYLKNGKPENVTGIIKEFNDEKGFVVVYLPEFKKNKKIKIMSILKTEQSPQRVSDKTDLNPVIFEVSGRLAGAYKLKPSEYTIDHDNASGTLIVVNPEEDREALMLRLLKYGECCRVLKPADFRKEFIELIDKVIKNLESDE